MYAWYVTVSLVTRLSPHKEVTSGKEVIDFLCLALAVPIRLQNETMCRSVVSGQFTITHSIINRLIHNNRILSALIIEIAQPKDNE